MHQQFYNKKAGKASGEKGLTTIELLIAMTIFLIVISSVYGILRIGNMSRSTINSRSENIKNVRMAVNYLGREAVNAGLGYNRIGGTVPDDFTTWRFGLPADPDKDPDLLTAISTGVNIDNSGLSKNGEKNDVVAFAFRDFQFNNGLPVQITDVVDTGTSLILNTKNGACADCQANDLYLIEAGNGKQALVLSTIKKDDNSIVLEDDGLSLNYGSAGSAPKCTPNAAGVVNKNCLASLTGGLLGILTGGLTANSQVKKCPDGITANCINYTTTSVVAKKIFLVSYNIDSNGTLIRTTFGNNTSGKKNEQVVEHPIANGIRSFKLQYLLSDGTVADDPSAANLQKEKCNDIVQIIVTVTVESETNENGVISKDPVVLSSTFSTRNLKYDAY